MNHYPKYSKTEIIIHWSSALLVLIAILLPFSRYIFSQLATLYMLHKSLGVLIFFLTILRIFIILKQGVPDVLAQDSKLQRIMAKSVQGTIYLLLIIIPISGYLMSSNAINFFNWFNIPSLNLPVALQTDFHSVHIFCAYLLIALICLHILAAIYHRFYLKDNVVKSMLLSN